MWCRDGEEPRSEQEKSWLGVFYLEGNGNTNQGSCQSTWSVNEAPSSFAYVILSRSRSLAGSACFQVSKESSSNA